MADKLTIYNEALSHLQERRLASLSVARSTRRTLDLHWDGAKAFCLERKFWNFIFRTVMIDASTQVAPAFGFSHGFQIPNDWIRTHRISASEALNPPLLRYSEEAGYWYADVTPIYVRYNSSDMAYGNDLSLWPQSFADYVAFQLAVRACQKITGSSALLQGPQGLLKRDEKAYKIAASICGMNNPIGFQPQSGWVSSRRGFGRSSGDTPGGSLIG
jgi:hypothetical protein